ncbi:HAD family hydrolase [Roseburia sp. OF03-24]|mgnify:FL=1|jgi:cation-transporting ATPase E|uniref:cation-translocating P-type ATPase n=1 Tax=Roseburia sp. OF03-24 TaxID=2292367 RepID=UPI000E47DCEC|nr:HAD family hydrolase [Roseburia sp. OF03-24]
MEENVNQTEKEMAENEKQKQAEKAVTENKNQKQAETIRGLTAQQVAERMEKGLWNKKAESATKTTKEIIKSNVFTYFNLIFLVIALLLIGVGAFRDLTFLPIIIANTLIGIVQEIRSKKVLDDLSILNSPKTRVIRDGSKKEIPADELVLDDIVELSAGGQIPADAVVLNGQLNVNESLLTGESDEIVKKSGDELLSGSFVVSGSCLARLTKVGEESYISKLTHRATQTKEGEQSEMIRSLNRLVQAVGIVIIPIGVVLFVQQFVYAGTPLRDSVTSMVAAILGMIPEGLYLLASVAMAVSAMRLAKQQVLIHDMKCIETLARVDVLCVDKTGTITVPDMEVDTFVLTEDLMKTVPDGDDGTRVYVDAGDREEQEQKYRQVREKIAEFAVNMNADNATMEAVKAYFKTGNTVNIKKADKVFAFSSKTKYSGIISGGDSYLIGAPEFVLREDYEHYKEKIEAYSEKGYRVLVYGRYEGVLDGQKLTEKALPVAFIMLTNAIREGAKETFSYFTERGVEIKVISGDNPKTVAEIAQKAGICGADNYVDASTLTTDESIAQAVMKYQIFGRVTPDQKLKFVEALKAQGRTVAMTGDGVNDVLALKDADCSIAMASGSEAASQVAQLVLLDNDFSRMPSVVMEGRRVVNNIQRSASLYLVKNIFSMLLAVFSMIFMINYPLEPSQISLISMFTIGIPSFVLALEPNKDRIQGHFMTNVLLKALPAGLTDFLAVSSLVLFCQEFGVNEGDISTSCTILVAIVGFMILYQIAKPMTIGHRVLMVGMVAGWLFCMIFVSHLFAIRDISMQCMMLTAVFAIATEPVLRYLSKFVEWLRGSLLVLKKKIHRVTA